MVLVVPYTSVPGRYRVWYPSLSRNTNTGAKQKSVFLKRLQRPSSRSAHRCFYPVCVPELDAGFQGGFAGYPADQDGMDDMGMGMGVEIMNGMMPDEYQPGYYEGQYPDQY